MHRKQILGEVVRTLRKMALAGTTPDAILDYLDARSLGNVYAPAAYLDAAFLQEVFVYLPRSRPLDATSAEGWRQKIFERRLEWEREPIPELFRRRDYFSFIRFAAEERVIVVVSGGASAAGSAIGRSDVRCYDGRMLVPTLGSGANTGLLAADPHDGRLREILTMFEPVLSYAAYLERLAREGLRVLGAEDGYVLEDAEGRRCHDGYRLLGVYDAETYEAAWTAKRGEKLRAALNRHLGAELVRFGPHDEWEHRNDRSVAGPLWGPQVPAIEFGPDQSIRNFLTVDDLAAAEPYADRWSELYPHHPSNEGAAR